MPATSGTEEESCGSGSSSGGGSRYSICSSNGGSSSGGDSDWSCCTEDPKYLAIQDIKEAILKGLRLNSLVPIRDAVSHLTRLDDFNVVKLSAGFFSEVFKVTHKSTKKVMVLKMNKQAGNRGNALKEIELLNRLNHPNVVAFMGTVVHEGQLHPLLEYLNAGTLENLIRRFYHPSVSKRLAAYESSQMNGKNLSNIQPILPAVRQSDDKILSLFCKLAKDVAQGMEYLHQQGYIHRDLTSRNVLIRRNTEYFTNTFDPKDLTAVIADFGFAANEPKIGDPKLPTVGSPYWLAPECLRDLWYNHTCDIFSFGIICCELNWRIPADPDFLPRDNHFLVIFNKLDPLYSNTTLAKVARLAVNENPVLRPEFSKIIELLEEAQEDKSLFENAIETAFIDCPPFNKRLEDGDIFDQHLMRRRNSLVLEANRENLNINRKSSISPHRLMPSKSTVNSKCKC